MTITPRDIEKLKAIGYVIEQEPNWFESKRNSSGELIPVMEWLTKAPRKTISLGGRHRTEAEAAAQAKAHAQSPEGMVATMAAKVRFLGLNGPFYLLMGRDEEALAENRDWWIATVDTADYPDRLLGEGASPEAAVDTLFWKVP